MSFRTPIISLLALFCMVHFGMTQAPVWEKVFGGNQDDACHDIQMTADSGFVMAGWSKSYGNGDKDLWVLKVDANGAEVWSQTFGGTVDDVGTQLLVLPSGELLVAGYTGNANINALLVKFDQNGALIWSETYGGNGADYAYDLSQTQGGGYILTGLTTSYGNPAGDVFLVKTDAAGIEQWATGVGAFGIDLGNGVVQTPDLGFLVTGFTTSTPFGDKDLYLLKTDAFGDTLWTRRFGGYGNDYGQALVKTGGDFALLGYTAPLASNLSDLYLLKVDDQGNELWSQTYGGNGDDKGYALATTADGGYILTGYSASFGQANGDVYLVKTDGNGFEDWSTSYGGSQGDKGLGVIQTPDLGYAVAGYKLAVSDLDGYVLRLDSLGQSCDASCVLPGDANKDGVANHLDVLSLGLAYGAAGLTRPDASIVWIPQPAPAWGDTLFNGVDLKYTDCNGDSMINADDTLAIHVNFERTYLYNRIGGPCDPQDVPLYLEFLSDSAGSGDTVMVDIILGTSLNPATSAYGLAFTLHFDEPSLIQALPTVEFPPSWFAAANMLPFQVGLSHDIHIGYSRIDQQNISGNGTIARLGIVMVDNLEGINPLPNKLNLMISEATLINNSGTAIALCTGGDSLHISPSLITLRPDQAAPATKLLIYPNPADQTIHLERTNPGQKGGKLINVMGKEWFIHPNELSSGTIFVGELPAGIYFFETENQRRKIVIMH